MAARRATLPGRVAASLGIIIFGVLALASGFDRLSQAVPSFSRYVPVFLQADAARTEARLAVIRQLPDEALVHARRAVTTDPLHPASTSLLGTAYLLKGDAANAEAAFRVAARFGWRDAATQLYWYEAALQSGDFPRAMDRADAILRISPGYGGMETILAPLEVTPDGRAALVRRMAGRPEWLKTYIQPADDMADEVFSRRAAVIIDLAKAGTSLGCDEVARFVDFALERGARDAASAIWTGHCPGANVASGLADGGFEQFGSPNKSPFGWTARRSGDVTLQTVDLGSGNMAIQASNRSSVSRLILVQALSVPAGQYRLTGSVQPNRLAGSVGCGHPPAIPSGVSGDIGNAGQLLVIPDCDRLQFGLWLRAGGDSVEIDDLKLERVR